MQDNKYVNFKRIFDNFSFVIIYWKHASIICTWFTTEAVT